MYQIGLFSRICHVTIKTLHYYNETGLLVPAYINPENGYRFYSSDQLLKFQQIAGLRQLGFSIPEIVTLTQEANAVHVIEQRRIELEQQIRDASDMLSRITHYLQHIKKDKRMLYQAVLKEIPECIVYSRRFILPDFLSCMTMIPAIGKEIMRVNPDLTLAVPAYCFTLYHDKEFKDKNIDVEFCEAVTHFGKETGDIIFQTIPAITAVTVIHKGPYETLRNAYIYLMQWVEDNGYRITDSPRESYIDGIWNKKDPTQWMTEIQFPVVKI
ncbi:MerR family transcriptional regulator [Salmonella enterica subsp. enterica serovar Enteritidis]|nr:MerR family transcriptional regulator [Salmonella enterica subsp. enterica serovar Enteritidis]